MRPMQNHNIAVTATAARLVPRVGSGSRGNISLNALSADEGDACVLEAVPQPFSFWKEVVPCTAPTPPPTVGGTVTSSAEPDEKVCFEYHAGYMNRLKPRMTYYVRSSFDEFGAVDALVDDIYKFEESAEPREITLNGAKSKYVVEVWGAGGGSAPEWYMKPPSQIYEESARMSHGCEENKVITRSGYNGRSATSRGDCKAPSDANCGRQGCRGGDCALIHDSPPPEQCQGDAPVTCAEDGIATSLSYVHKATDCQEHYQKGRKCGLFDLFRCRDWEHHTYATQLKCSPNDEVKKHFQADASCTDIDECTATPNICGDDTACFNTDGSFFCGRGSNAGYLKTTIVVEGYSALMLCPGQAGGSVDPSSGTNNSWNNAGTGGKNMCDHLPSVQDHVAFPTGGNGNGGTTCPWQTKPPPVDEWPWEPHACGGGGGGGGSGILAKSTATSEWEWVLIVGGGAGANYRGKAGLAGLEGIGLSTVNGNPGVAGTNHGGGGGGGAGEAAVAASADAAGPEVRARSGGTRFDTTHTIAVETHTPSNKQHTTAGNVPEEEKDANIGIGGHVSQTVATRTDADRLNNRIRAGNGLIDIEERPSQDSYKEVWVKFSTTCSCIVEPTAPAGQDPHDGKPTLVRATQTWKTMGLSFYDHSGCEDAYQFFRNGTSIGREYNERAECFEMVDARAAGDPLDLTDSDANLIADVGDELQYCVRAVGPPVGTDAQATAYYSGKECIDVKVKWAGVIGGTVMTRSSSTGVSGVLMTAYILTAPEANKTEIQTWFFTDPNPEEFTRQNDSSADYTVTRRRREVTRYCPEIDAADVYGLPVHRQFDRTRAGDVATALCPDIGGTGGASRSLTRAQCVRQLGLRD